MSESNIPTIIASREANNNYSAATGAIAAFMTTVAIITAQLGTVRENLTRLYGAKFLTPGLLAAKSNDFAKKSSSSGTTHPGAATKSIELPDRTNYSARMNRSDQGDLRNLFAKPDWHNYPGAQDAPNLPASPV
ncbi:hypothetical protein LOC68_27160 [Blastopirellula sp. JC732]|uniref:Uncharacterized protein n=1 Tax=Blastopirellula sediminis TaxID=2894196 RepID=A0A9X1MTG1_9BACT|nr:hypothetical protein [Blastopirellula sediminis]MCC9604611.1 hypothetical protein [Blastopirellula sediminis]MCC9632090.1 hypothetical protein [Blastopirellula sediminis]